MDFTIDRKAFSEVLKQHIHLTKKSGNMPILSFIECDVGEEEITTYSTNLEAALKVTQACSVVKVQGECLIPAQRVFEILQASDQETVRFSSSKDDPPRLNINCGSSYKLITQDPEEFPEFTLPEALGSIRIDPKDLARIIGQTEQNIVGDAHFSSLDILLFENVNGKLRAIGTNGYTLSYAEAPFSGEMAGGSFILPQQAVKLLQTFSDGKESLEILFAKNRISVKDEGRILQLQLSSDRKFPDYKNILKRKPDAESKSTVNRIDLLSMLQRAAIVCSERHEGVVLELKDDKLVVSIDNNEVGIMSGEISSENSSGSFQMTFNNKYLIKMLEAMTVEAVNLSVHGPATPLRFMGEPNFEGLVMPISLKG